MVRKRRSSPTEGPSAQQVHKCARRSATAMLLTDHSSTDHLSTDHSSTDHSSSSTELPTIPLSTEQINS